GVLLGEVVDLARDARVAPGFEEARAQARELSRGAPLGDEVGSGEARAQVGDRLLVLARAREAGGERVQPGFGLVEPGVLAEPGDALDPCVEPGAERGSRLRDGGELGRVARVLRFGLRGGVERTRVAVLRELGPGAADDGLRGGRRAAPRVDLRGDL